MKEKPGKFSWPGYISWETQKLCGATSAQLQLAVAKSSRNHLLHVRPLQSSQSEWIIVNSGSHPVLGCAADWRECGDFYNIRRLIGAPTSPEIHRGDRTRAGHCCTKHVSRSGSNILLQFDYFEAQNKLSEIHQLLADSDSQSCEK